MSNRVYLTGHLKNFSEGRTEFVLSGDVSNVGELLDLLWQEHAALRDRIITEQGDIREHINIFYDGRDIRRLDGFQTTIDSNCELHIFNAVSGG